MGDQYDWPAGWRTIVARRIHRRDTTDADKGFGWLSAGVDDGRSTGRLANPVAGLAGVYL
jgi:hypothetical protein